MPRLKRKKKRRQNRKDKIPFGRVRKPIPKPGGEMRSKKDYSRKQKYPENII